MTLEVKLKAEAKVDFELFHYRFGLVLYLKTSLLQFQRSGKVNFEPLNFFASAMGKRPVENPRKKNEGRKTMRKNGFLRSKLEKRKEETPLLS